MERAEFAERLQKATDKALGIAKALVSDELPTKARYLVRPGLWSRIDLLKGDEEVFPDIAINNFKVHLPAMDADGVVDLLLRNGKVPKWIDTNVDNTDGEYTYVFLYCSGRYSAGEYLFYKQEGKNIFCQDCVPPFCLKFPCLPKEYQNIYTVARRDISRRQRKKDEMPTPQSFVREYGKFPLRSTIPRWEKMLTGKYNRDSDSGMVGDDQDIDRA